VAAAAFLAVGIAVAAWTASGSGSGTVTSLPFFPPIPATVDVDIDPDTLNPDSEGKFVTAYIELPPGYDVADIDVSSVRLCLDDDCTSAQEDPTTVGDEDQDDIPDLMVKFSREAVIALLDGRTGNITFTVRGDVSGRTFEGTDLIRVLDSQGDAADAEPAAADEPPPPPSAPPAPNQTATPAPTATIGPSPSPTPVATASATPVPTASATPVPTASATPVPTASPTPSASPVPAPGGIYVSVTCQGQPVAGAQVSIIGLAPGETLAWSGGTGDDGELSTGLVLNAGSYVVDILKQGASYDSVIATVPAGAYAPVYAQCTAVWGTGYRN